MKKYLLGITAILIAAAVVAFTQKPAKDAFDTRYFRYLDEDDMDFNTLKTPASWDEITLPATGCDEGDLPCIVSVDNLTDYGGSYSPGVIDEVDFARFLELQGSTNAADYVTGEHQESSKESID